MSDTIQTQHFTQALNALLEEVFENVHGIILDKGTSMFETLADISAEEASIPVGGKCATLAAQVKHTAFYLDTLIHQVTSGQQSPVDWDDIWNNTRAVDADEWQAIIAGLRASYDGIKALVASAPGWPSERHIGGAIGAIAHTAYHLGEIRQALCTLRP